MPHWRLYYHVVWATRGRETLLDAHAADRAERSIRVACKDQGALVHAVATMPDHVHVVASIPPAVAIGSVVGRWKGSSSHLLNHAERNGREQDFAWQAEYGVMSFGEKALADVIAYVQDQPARHATRRLWTDLEHDGKPSQPASAGFVG